MKYLLDAGVLLRFSIETDLAHEQVKKAVHQLLDEGHDLCYTFQLVREFWSVATRPRSVNGYGVSLEAAELALKNLEAGFMYLPDTEAIRDEWIAIVTANKVLGKNAHDAGHVAAMRTHGIERMLSLDQHDFSRFADIKVIHPRDLLSGSE